MRIAFVCDTGAVNSNYRAFLPMHALQARGHDVWCSKPGQPHFQLDVLLHCDAVLVHRFVGPQARKAMAQLAAAGVGLIWDNDDDLANVPRSNPHYARFGGLNRQRIVSELTKVHGLADVVTTPSAVLATRFRSSGAADVRVVENFVSAAAARVVPAPHRDVVVACLAGLEHQPDYATLRLSDVLARLLDAHPTVRILSIGLGLGLRSDRYEHRPLVGFPELVPMLAHADIGLAPLIDSPWNQARSNVKLKEYGSANLAWLASPIGAYRPFGEREGGHLVSDDDWYGQLDHLISRPRERAKLAKRASKWAQGQTIEAHVDAWERVFEAAAEGGRRRRAWT